MKQIYLDNAATTIVDSKVIDTMLPYFKAKFGNASSQHFKGKEAKEALDKSREVIAKEINAKSEEIIFTSGGTESNNLALKGLFFSNYPKKNHIITTKIEHDSILNVCRFLEKQGVKVTYLDVDNEGFINIDDLKKTITEKTIVVSIIHGNNEIGTIQNLERIGEICKERGVLFHTDACQSFTKTEIDAKKQNLDLITLNSHKIHGPKGVGGLFIKNGITITPLFHGGGHERKLRSGTENISGIVGFSKAVEIINSKDIQKMEKLRDKLITGVLKISNTRLNGSIKNRLCNNINISFNNIEGEAIGGHLENRGIYASTGSACMSNTLETSHVLKALGLPPLESNSSLRMSISKYTTDEEINYVLKELPKIVEKLRRISPLVN
ncbi:cysteine desulfurase NifS [Candidatus Pacearchaeota archaeon]|jgi:cysteine desulfurase|nr:cysteine desulfurase NifS [Candidatus Pacearchaeota archaeon]|tara:strand:+ start:2077 stop:3222 length:1146 start_codon:yes stop_codon:yes gene_type:complete